MAASSLVNSVNDAPRARVVRGLKEWIDQGILMDGQPLPSERVLSEEFQVDRGTVRRALAVLDGQGLLRSHNGRTRILNIETVKRGGVMENAVAVLTNATGEPWVGHRQSGWSEYIGHGAVHAIRRHGLHAMALNPRSLSGGGMAGLLSERPRGVIVTDVFMEHGEIRRWADDLRRQNIPVVLYSGAPEFAGYDRVMSDQERGNYLLTNWLISQGRKRILPLWQTPITGYWMPQRHEGYLRAMREAGLQPLEPVVVECAIPGDHEEILHQNARQWASVLAPHLTGDAHIEALMLSSDGFVPPAAEACRLLGMKPNLDVVLTGYDNYWQETPESKYEFTGPMATVDKQNLQMGAELVTLLLDRIASGLPGAPQCRVVCPELVVVGAEG